ncbi:MAG TPA: alginate lyase family protein [Tepidisphaeraceae bacterium]|nr:alginate lyase family protein [Tepidisphaeraceae bacterium]
MPRVEIQQLENRVLLSAAPTSPQEEPLVIQSVGVANLTPAAVIATPDDPTDSLTPTVRSTLVSRLNPGALKTQLSSLSGAAFDQALLDYMRAQTSDRFFFGPTNLADRLSFISANGLQGSAVARADDLMLHLFPQQGDAAVYDVQLPDTIDFDSVDPAETTNAEFLPYLNRFEYWMNLGQAHLYTSNADYVREIVNQLSSFALQAPTADPATWATTGGVSWDLLSASLRVEHWIWTYQMVLNSAEWTKEANTLFISRLWEHGDFLARAKAYEPSTNRSLFHAKSEMMLAQVFPEFLGAPSWELQGRNRMFAAMDAQLYNDGSHVEQSPNYTGLVIEDVLEAKWLDELNGDLAAWPTAYNTKLNNAIESYRQMLAPDASQPAIGDTYRNVSVTMFTKAALIQDLITVKTSVVNDPAAADYAQTHTALKVADATRFAVGDQIHLQDRIEVMLVTGVNLGTNTLSVQRGYGTETRSWANGQTIFNLGNKTVARARVRDVYLFGDDAMEPFIDIPATPPLGERGKIKALTDSGNYIARSHGNDKNANQIIFDAGPTGGSHGHFDLLNFELYGGGRPLISDPGAYLYGSTADRAYVVSTKAHNTVSILGQGSHAALEGANNPGFVIDQYTTSGSSMHITAHHHAYQHLAGRPVIGRSMWYDLDGTIVLVDWAESNTSYSFQQSYNLQTEGNSAYVSGVEPGANWFKTNYPSGRNVKIQPLSRPDQTVARGGLTFVTNDSTGNQGPYKDDAYRFTVTQTGTFVYFVTLITAYDGLAVPDTTATLLTSSAAPGQPIQVELTQGGIAQTITFAAPQLERPTPNLGRTSGGPNDIEYDSAGRLHVAYYDRAARVLKYTVQETSGLWSIIQTIDNSHMAGEYISLALDSNNLPGVAYYEGNNGDLKYAKFNNGAWEVVTVDGVQNVGLYPSLVFSRNNGPIISYYHHTKKDLRMAVSQVGGFSIATVDSAGDVGRWTSMVMDPNRTDASKMAIAYEDTSNGDTKCAIQGSTAAFAIALVDNMVQAGGYNSLAFYDSGVLGTKRYRASISYYNAGDGDLRYAYHDGNATWASQRIAFNGNQGLYSQLVYDNDGRANIFYFDRSTLKAKRAKKIGASWTGTILVTGGREISVAKKATGQWAYTTLDESLPRLDVEYLAS